MWHSYWKLFVARSCSLQLTLLLTAALCSTSVLHTIVALSLQRSSLFELHFCSPWLEKTLSSFSYLFALNSLFFLLQLTYTSLHVHTCTRIPFIEKYFQQASQLFLLMGDKQILSLCISAPIPWVQSLCVSTPIPWVQSLYISAPIPWVQSYHFVSKLYIPFRHPFRYGHWNGIFRYKSIPAFCFGFTANIYIYIYN